MPDVRSLRWAALILSACAPAPDDVRPAAVEHPRVHRGHMVTHDATMDSSLDSPRDASEHAHDDREQDGGPQDGGQQDGGRDSLPMRVDSFGDEELLLQSFDGPTIPTNGTDDAFPENYRGEGSATVRLGCDHPRFGSCLEFTLQEGFFYPHWHPQLGGGHAGFFRQFVDNPEAWRANTYNRLTMRVRVPIGGMPLAAEGKMNCNLGTYVKRPASAPDYDPYAQEELADGVAGATSGHFYHNCNIPPNGCFTRLIFNHTADNQRGGATQLDVSHPFRDSPEANYFDGLTRLYLSQHYCATPGGVMCHRCSCDAAAFPPWPQMHPQLYAIDDVRAYVAHPQEDDARVYSIAANYCDGIFTLTWSRHQGEYREDGQLLSHEVRFAFEDIHALGWENAWLAPDGIVEPAGPGAYNGVVYRTDAIDVTGHERIFFGIRAPKSPPSYFSQVPLYLDSDPDDPTGR